LVLVISGRLASFGIDFSTFSAQFSDLLSAAAVLQSAATSPVVHARRRRRRGKPAAEQLADTGNVAASYSRYSSDQQREESISDQQRKCNEAADTNGHRIFPELEFEDQAVSGTKLRRDGLDAMIRAAENGEFHVLYFHSLSRLARESVITMPLLKRLVYVLKVRVISVTEGIDSARDGWDVIASIMSLMHERYIKELSENVFRGQEGAVLAGLCVGDYRFGYKSEPIPGSETTRRGRNAKPRMTYVIEESEAAWVIRIYHWYVIDKRSLSWITRELNRRGAPKDHRSTTKSWHHALVVGVLSSKKYIGRWPWGEMKNVRDPMTGAVHQEARDEEECGRWMRAFPHLRIVSDDMFAQAQQLLQENYEKYAANRRDDGTLDWSRRGSSDCPPRHLLHQLIQCGACEAIFHVSGGNAKYQVCSGSKKGVCECRTQLRRDRAERMILERIGSRILSDPAWFQEVFRRLQQAWERHEAMVPTELGAVERAIGDVDQKIARLVDRVEKGDNDPDICRRLEERREERRQLIRRRDQLQQSQISQQQAPTEDWLRGQLQQLDNTLHEPTPAAAYALRDLVGGSIVVTEIKAEGKQRHHLRGSFTLRTAAVARAAVLQGQAQQLPADTPATSDGGEQIVIDFVDPDPLDEESERAKALYDQGLLNVAIAQELKCSKSQVTKLLHHWFESRGLQMPDGRARRSGLAVKHVDPPLYQQLADKVMELVDQGALLQDIATAVDHGRDTITAVIRFWHQSRGLPVPDGRTRRKSLPKQGDQQTS
jgi:site-specific DNA recombinase